jgi:hypothetical protein
MVRSGWSGAHGQERMVRSAWSGAHGQERMVRSGCDGFIEQGSNSGAGRRASRAHACLRTLGRMGLQSYRHSGLQASHPDVMPITGAHLCLDEGVARLEPAQRLLQHAQSLPRKAPRDGHVRSAPEALRWASPLSTTCARAPASWSCAVRVPCAATRACGHCDAGAPVSTPGLGSGARGTP